MPKVKIDEKGFVMLRIYIKPCSGSSYPLLEFKVDSGASSTTISKKDLLDLGYDDDWIKQGNLLTGKERPSTASGEVLDDCYKVILPEIRLGKWTGYNWSFLVRLNDDENKQFRLLFGTDSMRFFTWFFDYGNGYCEYLGIEGAKYTLFNHQEQSLHSVDEVAPPYRNG